LHTCPNGANASTVSVSAFNATRVHVCAGDASAALATTRVDARAAVVARRHRDDTARGWLAPTVHLAVDIDTCRLPRVSRDADVKLSTLLGHPKKTSTTDSRLIGVAIRL
jgi:hypothetical protein